MLKTREVQVGQVTITLQALPATDASDLTARLAQVAGPAFAALTSALGEEDEVGGALRKAPDAARLLFSALSPQEFRTIRELLLKDAAFVDAERNVTGPLLGKVAGSRLSHFDVIFSGRLVELFPVLWAAIELNLGFSIASALESVTARATEAASRFLSRGKSSSSGPATVS